MRGDYITIFKFPDQTDNIKSEQFFERYKKQQGVIPIN